MPWWRIWRRRTFTMVAPAKAGAHAPWVLVWAGWQTSSATTNAGGYGIRRDDPQLRPKTLRRAGDRDAAGRCHAHHREAALVGAVGTEPKQAIDAGKARRVDHHLGR